MSVRQYWTTSKGTQLPLLNLRGKEYLQVAQRIIWFREENPDWSIETFIVSSSDKHAVVHAVIKDQTGRIIQTAHKREDQGHFGDFLEKAETSAIGRALSLCGYGTQFCMDDLDEGTQRLADSPIEKISVKPVDIVAQMKRSIFEEAKAKGIDAQLISFINEKFGKDHKFTVNELENIRNELNLIGE